MSEKENVVTKDYKDRLFQFIFGQADHKDWTLSLYNAVNDSDYADPEAIEFNTIKEALYLGMHNDVSFIIAQEMNLYEHQSTYNPNMPLRQMQYVSGAYEAYVKKHKLNKYGVTQVMLPTPHLIVFYNGAREVDDCVILNLSDAFSEDTRDTSDIQVRVKMLNINAGRNKKLMEQCRPLFEYAWVMDTSRRYKLEGHEDPVDETIRIMPMDFVIRDFIMAHREEVKDMLLTEYNEAASHELFQLEGERIGHEKGLKEGLKEGLEKGLKQGADVARLENIRTAMQKLNLSADAAMDFFDIPQELREKYAKEL